MSQSICTENFDNLFIQRRELITLTKIRVQQFATSSISLSISACNNDSCFFFIFETLFANDTREFFVQPKTLIALEVRERNP